MLLFNCVSVVCFTVFRLSRHLVHHSFQHHLFQFLVFGFNESLLQSFFFVLGPEFVSFFIYLLPFVLAVCSNNVKYFGFPSNPFQLQFDIIFAFYDVLRHSVKIQA